MSGLLLFLVLLALICVLRVWGGASSYTHTCLLGNRVCTHPHASGSYITSGMLTSHLPHHPCTLARAPRCSATSRIRGPRPPTTSVPRSKSASLCCLPPCRPTTPAQCLRSVFSFRGPRPAANRFRWVGECRLCTASCVPLIYIQIVGVIIL